MTPVPLIKVATVTVLTGSMSACVVPFVVLPLPGSQATAGVQPVVASEALAPTITAQDRRERRERREERRPQVEVEVADESDDEGGQIQTTPTRPPRNDVEDDIGRDGGQTFSFDPGPRQE